ncbi:hypothetical protein RSAG8_08643, partial [Rhizoctonia solani AG-8 WAC10335]
MSASNSATANPNQPPTFTVDESADPASAIQELRSLLTLLHSHTRNTLIDHGTQINGHDTLLNGHAAQIHDLQDAVDAIPAPVAPSTLTSNTFSITLLHSHTRNTLIDHGTQINGHDTLLNGHAAQIHNLQDAVDAIPAPVAPSTLSLRSIKGAKLGQFSGRVQDVERFLQDLRDDIELQGSAFVTERQKVLYMARDDIELQGSAFVTERQKVLYMASFLRETQTAHDWVTGTRISHPDWFDDFATFARGFEAHFGSPNKIDEALRKLNALKQTGSASAYSARFREISAALPQEEFFLSNMFFNGLKQEVQRWIYQLPDGKTGGLDQLITRAIDSDNRLHEWSRTSRSAPSSSTPASTSSHSTSQTTSSPVPMEIGATRVIKTLDATEKERRKRLGLCSYCGGSHSFDTCQLLKEKNERKASGKATPRV